VAGPVVHEVSDRAVLAGIVCVLITWISWNAPRELGAGPE
jgi:hypothetical protein